MNRKKQGVRSQVTLLMTRDLPGSLSTGHTVVKKKHGVKTVRFLEGLNDAARGIELELRGIKV